MWLYFRVLGEPNPEREGQRMWRLGELARRATALSGRKHRPANVSGTVRTSLVKRNYAHTVSGGHNCTLWCLTEEARVHCVCASLLLRSAAARALTQRHTLARRFAQGLARAVDLGALRNTPAELPPPAAEAVLAAPPPTRARRPDVRAPRAASHADTQTEPIPALSALACVPREEWDCDSLPWRLCAAPAEPATAAEAAPCVP